MKKYLVLVFMFGFINGLAQVLSNQEATKDYFYYDHIPKGDTLLKGWKYHAGDDKKWADPSFNDQDWEQGKFDSLDIYDFMKSHPNHLGWFRLKFRVADSLSKKHLMMSFNAVGASEVYLNGHLVKIFGKIDNDPAKVEGVNMLGMPFTITLSEDSIQVIAIRFAYPVNYFHDITTTFFLQVSMGGDSAFNAYLATYRPTYLLLTSLFVAGLFLMLAILHGGFFYFYRKGIQNFYYSVFAVCVSIGWLLPVILALCVSDIEERNWLNIFHRVNLFFSPLIYLLTIRAFFSYTKRKSLYFLLTLSVVAFVLYLIIKNPVLNGLLFQVSFFYSLDALRITYIKRDTNNNATRMIRTGLISSLIFYFVGLIFLGYNIIPPAVYFLAASSLANALMMSLAIARKVGDTNIELQKKLIEVEELSAEKQNILMRQNSELEEKVMERTLELKTSLNNLTATQSQLIQSEKMASLGELTAGIAHEIQNPLNFVNNFSEVNEELLAEMKDELNKGNIDDAKIIANNAIENQQKILHHGKRADAIVKGMLQHSRSHSGAKELTDINALCDEYLRLSYHGLRAKDKSFNAKFETHLDTTLPKINVIPQDIGRVVLNLINNAFYAVNEKSKREKTEVKGEPTHVSRLTSGYEPLVIVRTKKVGDKVEISVQDNGNGIPDKIKDKIFQPFFTTKPTGQGTGLGLSLSYDIVKSHGGELKVETKEGEGTEFTIHLDHV